MLGEILLPRSLEGDGGFLFLRLGRQEALGLLAGVSQRKVGIAADSDQLTVLSAHDHPGLSVHTAADAEARGLGIEDLRIPGGALQGPDAQFGQKHGGHFCLLSVSFIACVETERSGQYEQGRKKKMAENYHFLCSMVMYEKHLAQIGKLLLCH